MDSKLEGVKAVFLDLDGTIYLGGNLIPGALEFLPVVKSRVYSDTSCRTTHRGRSSNMWLNYTR